ncbi:MAG: invasion associated locus B family protein [Rhizomicrobium sp.]
MRAQRRRRMMAAAAIAMMAAPAGAKPTAANPDDVPTTRQYFDWSVSCPAMADTLASCAMQQEIRSTANGQPIARLLLYRHMLYVTLPFNVLLEPGIAFDFGGPKAQPSVFPFALCGDQGCLARIAFDDGLAASFKAATATRLLFAGLDGKPIYLPVSTQGFESALGAYQRFETQHDAAIAAGRK